MVTMVTGIVLVQEEDRIIRREAQYLKEKVGAPETTSVSVSMGAWVVGVCISVCAYMHVHVCMCVCSVHGCVCACVCSNTIKT